MIVAFLLPPGDGCRWLLNQLFQLCLWRRSSRAALPLATVAHLLIFARSSRLQYFSRWLSSLMATVVASIIPLCDGHRRLLELCSAQVFIFDSLKAPFCLSPAQVMENHKSINLCRLRCYDLLKTSRNGAKTWSKISKYITYHRA